MPRQPPNRTQDFLSSVILPLLSIPLLPISLTAITLCLVNDRYRKRWRAETAIGKVDGRGKGEEGEVVVGMRKRKGGDIGEKVERMELDGGSKGCVIVSGGRMSKGLT